MTLKGSWSGSCKCDPFCILGPPMMSGMAEARVRLAGKNVSKMTHFVSGGT